MLDMDLYSANDNDVYNDDNCTHYAVCYKMMTTYHYFHMKFFFRTSNKGIFVACKQNDIEKLLHALGKSFIHVPLSCKLSL